MRKPIASKKAVTRKVSAKVVRAASRRRTPVRRARKSPSPYKKIRKSSVDITPEARDTLLITILCTAFIAITFSAFSKDYNMAMYAMMAITVTASVGMILVVLLSKEQ